MFTAAVYIITMTQKQPKCLLINEMDNGYAHTHTYIYIYMYIMEYYLAIKRVRSCPL